MVISLLFFPIYLFVLSNHKQNHKFPPPFLKIETIKKMPKIVLPISLQIGSAKHCIAKTAWMSVPNIGTDFFFLVVYIVIYDRFFVCFRNQKLSLYQASPQMAKLQRKKSHQKLIFFWMKSYPKQEDLFHLVNVNPGRRNTNALFPSWSHGVEFPSKSWCAKIKLSSLH